MELTVNKKLDSIIEQFRKEKQVEIDPKECRCIHILDKKEVLYFWRDELILKVVVTPAGLCLLTPKKEQNGE